MNFQNNIDIDLLESALADLQIAMDESQRSKCNKLYESLRNKVIAIKNNYFEANFLMAEAKRLEKTSKEFWRYYVLITIICGIGFYLKLNDDIWKAGIAFLQIIVSSFFLLLISDTNTGKNIFFSNSQIKFSEAMQIEQNLKIYGESYEYSEPILKFIKEIKDNESLPFHEVEHASDILQIKLSIARLIHLGY